MYLITKLGGQRSYGNGDINSLINSYMKILGNADVAASMGHIERFLKSGIPFYNYEVSDTAGRNTRRIQAIAKHYAFHANAHNL